MKNLFFLCIGLLVTIATVLQNVGIGTSIPNAKLNVSGALTLADGSQGSGKMLTSDSTGLASWQPLSPPPGTDGPKVMIGSQTWRTKNLDVTTYRNKDPIPLVTNYAEWAALTTGAYCYYNNDGKNFNAYGKLYNWYAVNDPRGLAPEGWRIPTDSDWTTLGDFLAGNNVAGGRLKEIGTAHWHSPNAGATNSTKFTGLPGGLRLSDGSFDYIGKEGWWWNSTEENTNTARYRYMSYIVDDLNYTVSGLNKHIGCSVRCIKD